MMSFVSFGISGQNAPTISEKIVASTLNAIQSLLPQSKIEQVCAQVQYTWRDCVLSPAVTVLHMILAAIWPEESFNASWQVQWAAVASRYPELAGQSPSRGSVSKARRDCRWPCGRSSSRTSAKRPRRGAKPLPTGEVIEWCCWTGRVSRCRRKWPCSRPSASIRAIMEKEDIRWRVWRLCVWRAR